MREFLLWVALAAALPASQSIPAQSLRGSKAAMLEQHRVALQHDFTFLGSPAEVQRFVNAGYLMRLRGNGSYSVNPSVSFPYVRPEVKVFVERLSAQYRAECGQKLVVTSATRPRSRQPRNASPLSVHPAGMAVDLRVPHGRCRQWLESVLRSLDGTVLNATRERRPPHYHVAVYPRQYAAYVARRTGRTAQAASAASAARSAVTHRVAQDESLWLVARRYGTSVEELRRLNGIHGSNIRPGQELRVPVMVHRVARGEVLSLIAKRYGVTASELAEANDLDSPNRIQEGDRLFVPGSIAVHVVEAGDNLSAIADAYGTSVGRIREINKLTSSVIRPGQRLLVLVGKK